MCEVKGGKFLIGNPPFRIAWSFHFHIWLTLVPIFLPLCLALEAEEEVFPSVHGKSSLQVGAILVLEGKHRNHGYVKKVSYEIGK